MTDQTIPADQARRARQWARDTLDDVENGANVSAYARDAARTLIAMMPRPTLADMTLDEQDECAGMQADLAQGDRVVILDGTPDAAGLVQVLEKSLDVYRAYPAEVTPRPDLPRLEWPGTGQDGEEATKVDYVSVAGGRTAYGPWTVARLRKKPDPALPEGWRLADHPQYGPVVVTSMEPDDAGFVWFVRTDPYGGSEGYDAGCCKPDVLTFLAQGADTSDTVPESTLAVGSVWDDAGALVEACREYGRDQIVAVDKRGTAAVWDTGIRCWRVTAPHADFAPYTIIHTRQEADQ